MFYENEMRHIVINGKELPVVCDIVVLEMLQDKFGDLIKVKDQLQGFVQVKDQNGEWATEVDKDGNMIRTGYLTRPNVRTTFTAFAFMIQEGLEIEGSDEKVDIKSLMRQRDYTLEEVAKICMEEYDKTFLSKNSLSAQKSDSEISHEEN